MTGCPDCGGCPGLAPCTAGCGGDCCAGVHPVTPGPARNRPGLTAIGYRAGTYSGFLESMIARLASRAELAGYTTRAPEDPGIALLGCWALVADIVTFYAERTANEGFLGTATQPDSLTLLGRLVNYRPRPAVAASGYLAFTMDPGTAGVIPAGSQARSVAGPGELPQTFETSETLQASADWNQLEVRLTRPPALSPATADSYSQLTLTGTAPGVQPGTRLVFDFGSAAAPDVRVVTTVTPDFAAGSCAAGLVPVRPGGVHAAQNRLRLLIRMAIGDSPPGQIAQGVHGILDRFDLAAGLAAVADLARELTEALAIAAGRVPPAVASWLDGPVTDVLDQARATLTLMSGDQRRLAPDVDYLQQLARALICPDGSRNAEASGSQAVCDRAAPLVTAAAILPALRRPPSRPPARPAELPQSASVALDPQSTAVTALLTAADTRLAGVLGQAIGRQTATPPPATANVIAMKTKANPLAYDETPSPRKLLLDGTPDSLVPGSWFVSEQILSDGTTRTFANRIVSAEQFTRTFRLAGHAPPTRVAATRVTLDGDAWVADAELADPSGQLTVYYGGSPVPLADEPITSDVGGAEIALARTYDGLQPGRRILVAGERTDIPGTPGITASELTMVGSIDQRIDPSLPGDATLPVLVLAAPLAYSYKRDTVTISGNVAAATQGESRSEVLGSGSAGQAGQSFPLRQVSAAAPLTWLPDSNALGASDTLTVRVDGVRWHESDDLSSAGPGDRGYRVITAGDGSIGVAFGDGVHGARLPAGQENVTAAYRVGGGRSGNVAAGRITQLASRPLGVNAVTNPLPATGGTDGDQPGDIRSHAALRCMALDRLLSVQDYTDFTAARAGIGQATAAMLTDGGRELVYVTIAGAGDAPLDESDLLVTDLRAALAGLGDPYLPVRVAVRELLLLVLSAGIKVGADYSYDLVGPQVRAAALAAGGFSSRALGQPVYLSEIVSAMQAVPGVDYIDVDLFAALPATAEPVPLLDALLSLSGVSPVIDVRPARFEQVTHTVGLDPAGTADTLTSIALRHGTTVAGLVALNPQLTSVTLVPGTQLTVARGIRPAQLALLRPDVPQTLLLRSIP